MLTDIQISQKTTKKSIAKLVSELNLTDYEPYGKYKAKIDPNSISSDKQGKLILVTAINPTKYGEGKTTTSIGLADALNKIGHQTVLCLREPSLGPTLGLKGGACGGGYAQVMPMEDINLHFTGDIHAIGSAHNLISACIDNHIYQGNKLKINPVKIVWPRAIDLNDRALRQIEVGLSDAKSPTYQTNFVITAASEIMAILCLSQDQADFKQRVAKIIIGYNFDNQPITVADLKIVDAITMLVKDALKPNLVQTLEHNPVLIHGGPFANIAHGCNSLIATQAGLKLADYVVTEAGFGADLGAEKFFDIKSQVGKLKPDLTVLVATIRALKANGQAEDVNQENLAALKTGFANLRQHIENIQKFQLPVIVAINQFASDTEAEINLLQSLLDEMQVSHSLVNVFSQGSAGGVDLATKVVQLIDKQPTNFKPLYQSSDRIEQKLSTIAQQIYRAKKVVLSDQAKQDLAKIKQLGLENSLVCVAKTPFSFSADKDKLGAPEDFDLVINSLKINAGAGLIVAMAGNIMTMPGLPAEPLAQKITIDGDKISGLS